MVTDNQEAPKKKKGLKALLAVVVVVMAGALGYLAYTNPALFRADVLEVGRPANVPATVKLFVPDYTADATDTGSIAVKTNPNLTVSEDIVSVKFKLKYSPVNALQFNANSIVFETGKTLFQSADLKAVNTSTPGEVVVSLFSNSPVTIQSGVATEQTLFRLATDISGAAGSTIGLTVEDVEVIKKDAAGAFAASTEFSQIGAGEIKLNSVQSQNRLRVIDAEAASSTQIVVRFSDLLFPSTVLGQTTTSLGLPADYVINDIQGNPLVVTKVESAAGTSACSNCDQSAVLLTVSQQTPGEVYSMRIGATNIVSNTQGKLDANYDGTLFSGYQAPSATTSGVSLSSVDVLSSSEIILHFSGDLTRATVTPVNFYIQTPNPANQQGNAPGLLTVTKVDEIDGKTYRLTTTQQDPGANYFVIVNGVKDDVGKNVVNNRVQVFYGFANPTTAITQVKPNAVTNNQDQSIEILGVNLDTVTQVRLGTTDVTITKPAANATDSLSFIVPRNFPIGAYDLNLVNKFQEVKTLPSGFVVSAAVQPFRIVSGESRAVPNRVNPDGTTKIKLYALVEDPIDVASVDSVTIDLGDIGGSRAQAMVKDTGLQKKGQQFYTFETTVASTTPTKASAYNLTVEARKGSQTATGKVDLRVTNDVLSSVAPVVDQVSVNPVTVSPDGKTPVKISAKVTDQDGAGTISSVIADLTSLGAGFQPLKPLSVGATTATGASATGTSAEQKTAFFESAEFTIPVTTAQGKYKISVTASDATGESDIEEIELEVTSSLTGPVIDKDKTYLSPRKSVPNDGRTTFAINAMVGDSDGISDIDSVVAYFTSMGLRPVTLVKDTKATDSAKSALYSSESMVIPPTTPFGVHDIQIIATDKNGGKGQYNLKIDVTYEDTIGDAPIVLGKKSYTTPKIGVNDGRTRMTLYAFVRDDDQDLESVIVNLKGIGQVGPAVPAEFGSASAPAPTSSGTGGACPTGSNVIVCMTPSFTEGRDGQWFVLSDVTISPNVAASNTPYMIEVIATDRGRKVGRGEIPVIVRDSQNFTPDREAPQMSAVVAVAESKIEVVFNEAILASTVSSTGNEFTVTRKSDASQTLRVSGATINTDGNIVTLTTEPQVPGAEYVLTAKGVQDISGIALSSGSAEFDGFEDSTRAPVIDLVAATDQETVEIEFQQPIRPTGVQLGVASGTRSNFDVKITEADNSSQVLPIKSISLSEGGMVLIVKTNAMKSGERYLVQVENIASAAGNPLRNRISKFFKAINYRAVQQSANANNADLNGDGKVDFIDFTIFSASYGKIFGAAGNTGGTNNTSSGSSSQGLQPITSNPNSTVPITSTPAGGATR